MDWRSAPTRFSDASVTRAGPNRIRSRVPTVPTLIRVPRGRVGEGAAMPQFVPRPDASSARASGAPSISASAPAAIAWPTRRPAHATVGNDRHVASGVLKVRVSRRGDVADRGDLGDADPEHLARGARRTRPHADEDRSQALPHELERGLVGGRVADRDGDGHQPRELGQRERVIARRERARRRHLGLDEEQSAPCSAQNGPNRPGGGRGRRHDRRRAGGVDLVDPARDQVSRMGGR